MKITYAKEDSGKMFEYHINNIDELAKHILEAWSYEECVYVIKKNKPQDIFLIFDPYETLDNNNDWLESYGLGIGEGKEYYELYNIETMEIYKELN